MLGSPDLEGGYVAHVGVAEGDVGTDVWRTGEWRPEVGEDGVEAGWGGGEVGDWTDDDGGVDGGEGEGGLGGWVSLRLTRRCGEMKASC